jgi:hypothetical protein
MVIYGCLRLQENAWCVSIIKICHLRGLLVPPGPALSMQSAIELCRNQRSSCPLIFGAVSPYRAN